MSVSVYFDFFFFFCIQIFLLCSWFFVSVKWPSLLWQCIEAHEHVYVSWPHFTAADIYDVNIFGVIKCIFNWCKVTVACRGKHVDFIGVERQSISVQKWTESSQAKEDTVFWWFVSWYWRFWSSVIVNVDSMIFPENATEVFPKVFLVLRQMSL